ncbi:phospholipid methyltransferase-domain-containing protein [Pyronema omphalodes]|nr:phospholipid methyltransferase-domain-containing protein [Pyronema omphalodes]
MQAPTLKFDKITAENWLDLIDLNQDSLKIAAASIAFNPIFWNIVARQEYHNRILTKLFGGNSRYGCYFLAFLIFSLGIIRDHLYHDALSSQPSLDILTTPTVKYTAIGLFAVGNVLVLTSMWALGLTGTYLGDYFGILMEKRVTGFPFSVTDAPMYHGSTLSFLGTALWYGKPAGVALTAWVWVMYWIALRFEDPFTAEIYAKRDRERAKKRG